MKKIYVLVACFAYISVSGVSNYGLIKRADKKPVAEKKNSMIQSTALHQLVKNGGSLEEMTRLLETNYDPNARDEQNRTPLHWAAIYGRPEYADLLLSKDADVNARDFQGSTPLHLAGKYSTNLLGRKKMINNLIFYGGDVFARDNRGYTAAEIASAINADYQMLNESFIENARED